MVGIILYQKLMSYGRITQLASVLVSVLPSLTFVVVVRVLSCMFVRVWSVKPHQRASERLSHMEVLYIAVVFSFVPLLLV